MKIKIYSLFLFFCITSSLNSQTTFQNSYSLTFAHSIRTTYDGGYIVCGLTEVRSGVYNSHLTKLDSIGGIEWVKVYGEPSDYHHYGLSVVQTRDSGFVMTGLYRAPGKAALTKTDKLGNIQWLKIFSATVGVKVKQTSDDGYIITANNNTFIKTDNSGNLQWEASFVNPTYFLFEPHDVLQTIDNGYIAIGRVWEAGVGNNILVTKIDGAGNFVWAKKYELDLDERGYSIIQIITGEYILQGYHSTNNISSSSDNFVIKIDGMGNPIWSKLYPLANPYGGFQGFYNEIQITKDNGFVFGHEYLENNSIYKTFLTKIDSIGNVEWSNSYYEGYLNSLDITPDGGIVFTGWGWNDSAMYVVKTDSLGVNCNYSPIIASSTDVTFVATNISLFKMNSSFESSPIISTTLPTIITSNECLSQEIISIEPSNELFVPNVFTPNGDNTNDFFIVDYSGAESFEIKIYNRWGVQVFTTNDSKNYWNGRINNTENEVSDGTYYYILKIGERTYKGFLTLFQ